MKYLVVIIVLLLNSLHAESPYFTRIDNKKKVQKKEDRVKSPQFAAVDSKDYKKDLNRLQMLREAKFLTKKYNDALSKLENWDARKEELKIDFRKRNPNSDVSLGNGNKYGIKRAQKRRREYYKSLDKQEIYLQTRVEDAQAKLQSLKNEFLFQFAVPLTVLEMNGGQSPKVIDRDEKVEMLNNFINEKEAYKRCKDRVAHFESVKNVSESIEELFPDTKLTTLYIDTQSSQNQDEIHMHQNELDRITQEYKSRYGLTIPNAQKAKAIIQKIHSN